MNTQLLCCAFVNRRLFIFQVLKNQISLPDDTPWAGVYLDALSSLTMEDVASFGRKTHLNKLIPNPLVDHIHIFATSMCLFDLHLTESDSWLL